MRICTVPFRVLDLTAAAHLLPGAPPALAQTDIHYLVVPSNGFREGSYGVDSAGNQRMQSFNSCLPQFIGSCE